MAVIVYEDQSKQLTHKTVENLPLVLSFCFDHDQEQESDWRLKSLRTNQNNRYKQKAEKLAESSKMHITRSFGSLLMLKSFSLPFHL